MKRYKILPKGSWLYPLTNILLILILIVALYPNIAPEVQAQSDNITPEIPPPSENITPEIPPPSDNITLELPPPSENITPETPIIRKVTVLVSPDQEFEVISPSSMVRLNIPKDAVAAPVEVELAEHAPWESTGMKIINLFELNARIADSGEKFSQFNKELEISIQHTPEELIGLDIDSLRLYYIDEKSRQWVPVPSSKYDSNQRILTASIDHFSYYGEQANPAIVGPGRVMAAQVDLHSGTTIFNYPIELPPGPGGFQPSLTLNYNSGVADEMKNKRSVGSWVGIGWTLHLARITYEATEGQYYLDLNNASYKLETFDRVDYHTVPEQFYKITRSGNTWEMRDREGVYYRFGGTADSQQYYDSTNYYRWGLNLIRDTKGNEATVTYVRDIYNNSVRSAYPEYLKYGDNKIEVHFISSWDESGSYGPLRKDNPIYPAPKSVENRKLDAIEIKVNGTLLRKYTFAYNTTERVFTSDYGGTYYSGKHTLTSITEFGADGSSQLPEMSFTYQDLQTYFRDSTTGGYSGNPGNPASLNWPHLTAIDSGYGGEISFSYTQIPDTSATDIWTREVVATKMIDSGIGTNQTYTYSYSNGPKYFGEKWEAEYRGFGEIQETDAASNYTKHWFYTTGTVGGKDAEKLTGKEYQIQWYNSGQTLLKEQTFDWSWDITSQMTDYNCEYIGQFGVSWYQDYWGLKSPQGVAETGYGYIYVADDADGTSTSERVVVFDAAGNYIDQFGTSWSGDYYGLDNPRGVAVSNDGYVYVVDDHSNAERVVCFDADGNYITTFGESWSGYYNGLESPYGIAISKYGAVYVSDVPGNDGRIVKFDANGNYKGAFGGSYLNDPRGVAVSKDDYVYVADATGTGEYIVKFDANGNYKGAFGGSYLDDPRGVAVSKDGYVYVADATGTGEYIMSFDASGNYITTFGGSWYQDSEGLRDPHGVAVSNDDYVYGADDYTGQERVVKFDGVRTYQNWVVQLDKMEETVGAKTSRTRYEYDNYDNIITEYLDGDISTDSDNATIHRVYYPNTDDNILSNPARERVYATTTGDVGGANLKKETLYYYDGNNTSLTTPPTEGNLTRLEQKENATESVSSYFTYDTYGNKLTEQDPNGNTTTWTYETIYHTYPQTKNYPIGGLSESYTYDPGTENLLSITDLNGQVTTYKYDTFKRLIKVIKPGDSTTSPSIEYQYNNWGTLNQQHLKALTKVAEDDYLWRSDYFDGLGRVVQTQSSSDNGTARWLDDWENRVKITIDHTKIDGNLTHFPLLVHLSSACGMNNQDLTQIFTEIGGSYKKIAVTRDDGETQLFVEVEKWDNTAQDASLWVSKDGWSISNSEDSVLYLYYDSTQADNTGYVGEPGSIPAQNVWDSNFVLVDHMQDDPDTSHTRDSTSYSNDGTKKGSNEPVETIGKNGDAQDFDGSDDDINYGNDAELSITAALTLEGICNPDAASEDGYISSKNATGCKNGGYSLYWLGTEDKLQLIGATASPRSDAVFTEYGEYVHAAITLSTSAVTFYKNGIAAGTATDTIPAVATDVVAGNRVNGDFAATYFAGLIDEVRISSTDRSAAWLKATYYTYWDDLLVFSTPETEDKHTSYVYDGLGRVTAQTNADGTTINYDHSTAWQKLVTNERGYKKRYYYDAFAQLVEVEELDASHQVYATTAYSYDVLGNLIQVVDNSNNTATMTYDWLSRKTAMTDPDMGSWSYGYDDNSNLTSQTDAKSQAITFTYDALNRLTDKEYSSANMTDVSYSYDSTTGGNYGKGRRTGMTDALGTTSYKYDARGRLVNEKRTIDSVDYITQFTHDGADRISSITYPTGETVTQEYDDQGFPYSLAGNIAGSLVGSALYNNLGDITEINLGNSTRTIFGYWDVGGTYDTGGGYYGRLWRIMTAGQPGDNPVLQDIRHAWDAGGNLATRQDYLASETETFTCDFLDRLTGVSGPYSESYAYNQIGNITSRNGTAYTYGSQPHAVTAVGATGYTYDANGNMTARGSQTIAWDVENRPVSVSDNGTVTTFVYDGDGNRVKKTEGGETVLYVNKYYEKSLTTGNVTSYYYLGDRLVAMSENSTLRYIHQDHLTGTALVTDANGDSLGAMKYYPFGETRSGTVPTDKLFTGQRLDDTSLYYYGARYYDAEIGRFISSDTIVPNPTNPQALNRYTYALNNPLKYMDPNGHQYWDDYFYEASCAEAGVDPSAGEILVYEGGSWVSLGMTVGNFVSWIDDTPYPFDYISVVNIDMNSPFSVWEVPLPKASGQVGIKGSAIWTSNDVRVDIEVAIQRNYIAEGEVIGIGAAKIELTGRGDVWFDLQRPEGTYISPAGYSSVSGGTTVYDVPGQADVALEVGLFAYDRYANVDDPPFSRVEPWSWIVDLRTGDIRRNNNPWR